MNNKLASQIVFLTPTIGTKWLYYQQAIIKQFFPSSKRIIINGNKRWNFDLGLKCVWYDFIEKALKQPNSIKYFIHIDEDCFISDPNPIKEYIDLLEDENIDLIGPSDVIDKLRGNNPLAMNSFFMIGKISSLKKIMNEYDVNLKFKDLNINNITNLPESKIDFEPYYNFYWNYLKNDLSLKYISTLLNEKLFCTSLLTNSHKEWAYHMWFTRDWNNKKHKFLGKITHYDRYKNMSNHIKKHILKNRYKVYLSIPIQTMIKVTWTKLVSKNIHRIIKRLNR